MKLLPVEVTTAGNPITIVCQRVQIRLFVRVIAPRNHNVAGCFWDTRRRCRSLVRGFWEDVLLTTQGEQLQTTDVGHDFPGPCCIHPSQPNS